VSLSLPDSPMRDVKSDEIIVAQGEFHVSNSPNVIVKTLLGSCVATCLYDPVLKVGGMNHFLLATGSDRDTNSERYGAYAMEVLINGLLKLGARKSQLQAKVFGGATMSGIMGHIGIKNCEFATKFLDMEGFPIIACSLGGEHARAIRFNPSTGQVSQRLIYDCEAEANISSTPLETKEEIMFFGE